MKSFLKTKDFFLTGETFELKHDEEKEMLVTTPIPSNLDSYYESENYISHTDAKTDLISRLYQLVKSYNLRKKVRLINQYCSQKYRLLDVGAGTGDFLLAAKANGWKVSGVEPNSAARKLAHEKGEDLKESLQEYRGVGFQVITLWHVLEHLPDLDAQIANLKSLLSEDGVLVIAVPNFKSYDAKYYGKFWAAFDVPRHLWHFSRKSIKTLFENQGFKLVSVRPMIFDAFYVSLLSEKYKANNFQMIKGFFMGLISNLKAVFTGEYSSLTYILAKNKD